MDAFIILLTTFLSTILSSMSGGGASIINLPVFLALGLPFPVVVSIQKVSSVFWVLPAAYNYLKGRKVDWTFISIFTSVGLIGVYFGVLAVINIPQRDIEAAIGFLIIFLVIYTYFQKGLGLKEEGKEYGKGRKVLAYPFSLVLGFYESFFGSGNSILLAILTSFTRGFAFVDALGY